MAKTHPSPQVQQSASALVEKWKLSFKQTIQPTTTTQTVPKQENIIEDGKKRKLEPQTSEIEQPKKPKIEGIVLIYWEGGMVIFSH